VFRIWDPAPYENQNQDPGITNPDHISENLGTTFWVKYFFDADPRSGMEKIRIRDKHPGSAT
jgi:hypothetical protein